MGGGGEDLEGGPDLGAVTDIGDQVWILGLWYGSVLSHGMSHNATPSINTSSQTKALVRYWSQFELLEASQVLGRAKCFS